MNNKKFLLSLIACISIFIGESNAQFIPTNMPKPEGDYLQRQNNDRQIFNQYRGMNIIEGAEKDGYGNADGSKYDLVKDDALEGVQIAVLHLYTGENFNFQQPAAALREKGFVIKRWVNQAPSPEELQAVLQQSSQLWVISDKVSKLNSRHLDIIKNFFEKGKGVYIWGDNQPFYADANRVANVLFGNVSMSGNLNGDHTVGIQNGQKKGLVPRHDITTGLENLYEGITIATIRDDYRFTPLLYGSAGNLVASVYEQNGKRAIIDGGFTRLYYKWDTAGTGRYVRNAAAWLVNYDNFGDQVFRN